MAGGSRFGGGGVIIGGRTKEVRARVGFTAQALGTFPIAQLLIAVAADCYWLEGPLEWASPG